MHNNNNKKNRHPFAKVQFYPMRLSVKPLYKWTNICECLPTSFSHENRLLDSWLGVGKQFISPGSFTRTPLLSGNLATFTTEVSVNSWRQFRGQGHPRQVLNKLATWSFHKTDLEAWKKIRWQIKASLLRGKWLLPWVCKSTCKNVDKNGDGWWRPPLGSVMW